jgi:hypothetical protein
MDGGAGFADSGRSAAVAAGEDDMTMRQRIASRLAALPLAAVAVGLAAAIAAPDAGAVDYHRRWMIGVRIADYLPADEQGGGFRFSTQAFGSRTESSVKIQEVPAGSLSVGYGIKKFGGGKRAQDVQLTVQLEVTRLSASVGDETGFIDENASTRVILPDVGNTEPDGDETFETFPLGDLEMMPVVGHVLCHWGAPKADFYAGGGLGWVFADISEGSRYREFTGDVDGDDDVRVEDGMTVSLKVGSNVRLTKSGRWYLTFEAEYFTMNLLGGGPKVAWPGVEGFFGTRDYDADGDGTLDTFGVPSDLHVVDPGKVRLDGVFAGLGLRYRFGGKKAAAPPADGGAPAGP